MGRPTLLLDIDGVVAPFGPVGDAELVILDGAELWIPSDVSKLLRQLLEAFDFVWCTSWEGRANDVGQLVGLPLLSHVALNGRLERGRTMKLDEVVRFAGETAAIAWVDDELGVDAHAWAAAREAPTLLVHTNPNVGLTPDHVAELKAFAATLGP